jgi:muramidase (phage lysozyme)
MRKLDNIKKEATIFSEAEIRNIKSVKNEIDMLLEINKINEEAIRKLDNILTSLHGIRDNYVWRLLRAAKQNHMLD